MLFLFYPKGGPSCSVYRQTRYEPKALLLGERWKIILAGTPCKDIKTRNQSLYVKGRLGVRVVSLELEHYPSPAEDSAPVQLHASAPALSVQPENVPISANDEDSSQVNVMPPVN